MRTLQILMLLSALIPILEARCDAGQSTAQESGRAAMRSLGRVPWYDQSEDKARSISVGSTDGRGDDTPLRTRGEAEPKAKPKAAPTPANVNSSTGDFVGWTLISLLGIALVIAVVFAFWVREAPTSHPSRQSNEEQEQASFQERLERLPVKVRKPTGNLLDEAHRLMTEGSFNEAIVYLFSYQLVELDRHQALRLARGKTNRQYLRELQKHSNLQCILRDTVHVFEDAFFGQRQITRDRFSHCWQQLEAFDREIAPIMGESHS